MRFLLLFAFALIGSAGTARGDDTPQSRGITLQEAIDHAIAQSPRLAAAAQMAAADAARLQGHEGVPNPVLSVELEDFLGSGVAHGADGMQVTAALSQDIPLGGVPGARRRVNEAKRDVSALTHQLEQQLLVSDVAAAFLQLLAHQRRLANAQEMVALSKETVDTITLQVEAGRATAIEVDKADIVLSLARLEQDRIERELAGAKQALAAACGAVSPFFDTAKGELDRIAPLPDLAALAARLDAHPSRIIQAAVVREQRSVLDLEKASRVPDLSVSLGYRWINATSDSAMVAGVAVPLPVASRNKGAIAAAARLVEMQDKSAEQQRVVLHQVLTESFHRMAAEHTRATVLTKEVFPKVRATFDAVAEGYRLGRFGYLDLLDAQRTFFAVKRDTIEALIAYHHTALYLSQTAALAISPSYFEVTQKGVTP